MARPTPTTTGYLPLAVLCAGVGLLICAGVNALSRATLEPSLLFYWIGVLVIALPIFYRLTSREASASERLVLVCLLGLSLYAVKVIRDAPLFTFSDELVHSFNAQQISTHHHLFEPNPTLKVTPYYPGLEGATSALMNLTGMSSFGAGIFVVAVARLSMMIALFLLFSRIGGSARTAGLGVAIYAGNFNFLYWGAQFSYESLALPLLVVVMMALAEREAASPRGAREWAMPILLGMAAITVTHHITSYALAAVLLALAAAYWLVRRAWAPPNPWHFAAIAVVLTAGWLVVVASSTVGYLSPVIDNAIDATFDTALGEAPPRTLFQGGDDAVESPETIGETPALARGLGLLGVAMLAGAMPFGLLRVWRRYRKQPFVLILTLAAIGFFGTLLLRLAPDAWETGNRASEFLFIGLAFVVACAGLERWRPRERPWLGQVAVTAGLGVILVGGAISGWPWNAQLASPLRISAEGRSIVSPPLGLAEWARDNVEGGRFAANVADSRLLMEPGEKWAVSGEFPDIKDIIEAPALEGWELPLLRRHNLRYVVADRREIGNDGIRGYFFSREETAPMERLLPREAVTKFARIPGASRIYANGDIAVYDLAGTR
jgi:hypothetical protein